MLANDIMILLYDWTIEWLYFVDLNMHVLANLKISFFILLFKIMTFEHKCSYWPTVALKSIVIIHIDIIKYSEVVTTSSELCMSSNWQWCQLSIILNIV